MRLRPTRAQPLRRRRTRHTRCLGGRREVQESTVVPVWAVPFVKELATDKKCGICHVHARTRRAARGLTVSMLMPGNCWLKARALLALAQKVLALSLIFGLRRRQGQHVWILTV